MHFQKSKRKNHTNVIEDMLIMHIIIVCIHAAVDDCSMFLLHALSAWYLDCIKLINLQD